MSRRSLEYWRRINCVREEKGDTDGFLAMLRRILYRSRGRVILDLFVDHARSHSGRRVLEFLLQHKHSRLVINHIPKYHPELNLQETLWPTKRYEETSNTYYETVEEMAVPILRRSHNWEREKIHPLCHVVSDVRYSTFLDIPSADGLIFALHLYCSLLHKLAGFEHTKGICVNDSSAGAWSNASRGPGTSRLVRFARIIEAQASRQSMIKNLLVMSSKSFLVSMKICGAKRKIKI